MTSGVRLRPAEQVLVSRARDFLAAGPADAVDLIAHVCQLPSPAAVRRGPHGDGAARRVGGVRPRRRRSVEPRRRRQPSASWMGGTPRRPSVGVAVASIRALRRPLAHAQRAAAADRLADLSYVVVDVETTGGSSIGADRITEIAAVVIERGEISRVYETLVNPQRPIPPMVTRLTNITWNMVRSTRRRFARSCRRWRTRFVATCSWRITRGSTGGSSRREIARATGERMEGRRLCTVKMARQLLPQLHRRSLDYLARHYNVEITARHRAGGDAMATAQSILTYAPRSARPRLRDVARPRGAAARRPAWPPPPPPERNAALHRSRHDGLTSPEPDVA